LVFNIGMDISEIRRRNLRLIIDQRFAGTAAELARAIGKQPSEISRIFSSKCTHRRNVGSRLARRIEAVLGKETGWMDRPQVAVPYQAGPTAWPAANAPATDTPIRVPIVWSVQAKDAASIGRTRPLPLQPQEWITVVARVGKRAYALRVQGDSMEPKFPEGVTIIVDPDVKPVHGSFVIALLSDTEQTTFKQFVIDGRRYLKPLNPRYPIMEIDDRVAICGVVKQMIMSFD
jgi:SOS-response transcriptional repressor LexA